MLERDFERMSDAELDAIGPADCWVFADVLEHLVDPWRSLGCVRLPAGASVVACVPNMAQPGRT